ncbi:hypothetical protein [Inquilinus sp.]|uniref:hypothetical protein n=1 Tax=Inquilinus sp. TaxID=1932117 RepID=UPI0031E2F2C9
MTALRSPLGRLVPQEPAPEDQLLRMRRAAWLRQGVVMLRPEEIENDWLRQAVTAEAVRLYGRRDGR